MICPSCKREIADGSIICPICNTQFAFTVPGLTQTSNPNLYEVVENNNKTEILEESAYSPNANVLPTEISHYPEEEVNPEEYFYGNSTVSSDNEEYMSISGQKIEPEPYNPGVYQAPPIRPEAPRTATDLNPTSTPVIPQQNINNVQTLQNQVPTVSPNVNNIVTNQVNDAMTEVSDKPALQQSQQNNQNNTFSQTIPQAIYMTNSSQTNNHKKKYKVEDLFFSGVSAIGLIILVILIVSLFKNNKAMDEKRLATKQGNIYDQTIIETNNVGNRSSFNAPMKIGNTTLASVYDSLNQLYVDVDVTGLRFIEGVEAEELAKNYSTDTLNNGFAWYGLEYRVNFNDLKQLEGRGINPVLNSKLYLWNGSDYIVYNEKKNELKTYDVYSGSTITNNQSAIIKVIYQIPIEEKEYSVCFGYLEKTLGCFSR